MANFTALLIDDETDFATTLAERLGMRGIETLVAADGYEGLEMAREHRPPVIVLDMMMPGLSGLDVLREIKRTLPATEVILLTGHGLSDKGIEGMRQGAFDFLIKPVRIEELLDKMREAARKQADAVEDGGSRE